MVMKRLVSATLALTLLGGSAAVAAPYDLGGQRYNGGNQGYGNQYRGGSYYGHNGTNGGALVAGVGILILAAILASQHRHHHFHQGWYSRDGGRYDNAYNRGYSNQDGNRDDGYGENDRRW